MTKLLILASLISTSAFAGPVDQAIQAMKNNDIRITRHVVTPAEEDTVCTAAGDTIAKIEVKTSNRQESNGTVVVGHTWETVKTVVISPDGTVMEECLE
jgi:hypothetical protein